MNNIAARILNLHVSFNGRAVLKNINMEAPKPGITALVGRSGSGKTTLLRALNRLNEIFPAYAGSGCVQLDLGNGLEQIYEDCGQPHIRPLAHIRRLAGMVFQTPNVLPVGILANLLLPLRFVGDLDREAARKKAIDAIKAINLWPEVADRLNMPASRLSGGQQQRLCLARALALDPAILLLDEPTASLDAASSAAIEKFLARQAKSMAIILVSHNPGQACRLANRMVIMTDGEIGHVFDGDIPTSQELENMLEMQPAREHFA